MALCLSFVILCVGVVVMYAAPTDGFVQQSVTVAYQWPYNLNLSDRHTGTFPGLEHFWVYTNDAPHDPPPNTTAPRCEAVPSPRWTNGIWQFEGDVYVPSPSTGHNIMQVFGADMNGVKTVSLAGARRGRLAERPLPAVIVAGAHYGRSEDARMTVLHLLGCAFMKQI